MALPELSRHEQERLAEVQASVASRLQRVCDGMEPTEFRALVLKISEFKIKWGESLVYDNPPALGAWMFSREKGDKKK